MDGYDAVLIYDGECPYCSVAARTLEALDRVGAISWDDDDAQALLAAQLGEAPFAMFLVDQRRERVYARRSAASGLNARGGAPRTVPAAIVSATGRSRRSSPYSNLKRSPSATSNDESRVVHASASTDR